MRSTSEIRNPKSETNSKLEIRNGERRCVCRLGIRVLNLFRISDFGFRISALTIILLHVAPAHAQPALPPAIREVGWDQKLDTLVPLELAFRDETGQTVRLRDYFDGKPVILVLAYNRCPMLCNQVLNGLVQSMLDLPFEAGKDFNIVTVSFDPREQPELAAAKRQHYLERYGRPGAEQGWHFLTGEEANIKQLADAVGFRYRYDAKHDQYSHASGITLLTPAGKVSRYFFDVRFPPRDLRLGLVEASQNRIGSAADQILLYCFHYDPIEGKYGPAIMTFMRTGGVLTMIAIGSFMYYLWRGDKRARRAEKLPKSAPSPLPLSPAGERGRGEGETSEITGAG
jgi:protein SCO1/2